MLQNLSIRQRQDISLLLKVIASTVPTSCALATACELTSGFTAFFFGMWTIVVVEAAILSIVAIFAIFMQEIEM